MAGAEGSREVLTSYTARPVGHHDFVVDADRTGPKLAALWQLQHTAFNPHLRSLDDAMLARELAEAGFADVEVAPMIPAMTMLAQGVRRT